MRLYPPYLGASIRVTRVSDDFSSLRVEMPLTWYNRNYVGTHFGGNLYSMVDPQLMLMLMQRLGRGYVVWDQAATIRFVRPGTGRVHAELQITDDEVEAIRDATADGKPHRPVWTLQIVGTDGETVAEVDKTLYVRAKPTR